MPIITLPTPHLRTSVERPIAYSVLRRLMEFTQISHRTPIRYYGDEALAAQQNSTISGTSAANSAPLGVKGERNGAMGVGENRWPFSEQVSIEVDEAFRKERLNAYHTHKPGVLPVFEDKALGVYIKPNYRTVDVTIRIKYRAVDKNQADMWRNRLEGLSIGYDEQLLHRLDYHYCIEDSFQEIIECVHTLRENKAGYGEDLAAYVAPRLSPKVSVIANFNGISNALVVSETQGRVVGRFDFQGSPEKAERVGNSSAWEVTCSYLFSYEKPIEVSMQYPLMVHNQMMPRKYLPKTQAYNPLLVEQSRNRGYSDWRGSESDSIIHQLSGDDGLQIPSFDNYTPSDVIDSTVRVLSVLTAITPEDKRSLVNLKDLGQFVFEPNMLEFIRSERQWITKAYQSIFALSLYENNFLMPFNVLQLDDDLNVVATRDLDVRKTYRVRLGLASDIKGLVGGATRRVRNNYEIARKLCIAIDGAICSKGNVRGIMKNRLRGDEYEELGLSYNSPETGYAPKDDPATGLNPGHGRNANMRNHKLVQIFYVEVF